MIAIYEPKGAAREYAPLAVNLYSGCAHGCLYCYAPGCTHRTRADFAHVTPRKGILDALKKDLKKRLGDKRPVLLSFSSDPYPAMEATERLTRAAMELLVGARMNVRLLTKNPGLALKLDSDLLVAGRVEFGTTIIFRDDAFRQVWEPNAPTIESRWLALKWAHEVLELKTWVSVEPVINPPEAIRVISGFAAYVDLWKIGRWNHDARANNIDWRRFGLDALALLTRLGAHYYIKDALWKSAGLAGSGYAKEVSIASGGGVAASAHTRDGEGTK